MISAQLASAFVRISADQNPLRRDLQSAQRTTREGVQKLQNLLSTLGIGFSFGFAATEMLRLAANAEKLKTTMFVILKDTEKVNKLYSEIVDFSVRTPFEPQELAEGAKALLQTGTALQEVMPLLRTLGDVSAGGGGDLIEIVRTFAKVRSETRLTAETAERFVNRGVPIWQFLADQQGKSVAEIRKMSATGQVSFDMVQRAIKATTLEGGMFFQAMQLQSQTLLGLTSTLTGAFKLIGTSIGQQLAKPLLVAVRAVIAMQQGFIDLDNATGGLISTLSAVVVVFGLVTSALAAVNFALGTSGLIGALTGVGSLLSGVLFSPFALGAVAALAAILALTAGVFALVRTVQNMRGLNLAFDNLKDSVTDSAETAGRAFSGMFARLQKEGSFAAAMLERAMLRPFRNIEIVLSSVLTSMAIKLDTFVSQAEISFLRLRENLGLGGAGMADELSKALAERNMKRLRDLLKIVQGDLDADVKVEPVKVEKGGPLSDIERAIEKLTGFNAVENFGKRFQEELLKQKDKQQQLIDVGEAQKEIQERMVQRQEETNVLLAALDALPVAQA